MSEIKSAIPGPEWDQQLLQMGGHFLQSRAWAQFQQALGRPVWHAEASGGSWLAAERQGRGIKYLMAAYGPSLTGDSEEALESLVDAGRQARVDFVRFEPVGEFSPSRLEGAQRFDDVDPSHTWVLDLASEEETLRGGISQSNRNLINTAAKRNLSFSSVTDGSGLDVFLAMLADTAAHAGIKNYPERYYRTIMEILGAEGAAKLYLAKVGHQIVAGSIVYDFGSTRYYAHAAAFQGLNRLHKASVPLVWHMIKEAKAEGKTQFDFWGVAPSDDPKHAWAGITRFKQSFGGAELVRAGTWDIPLKPAKYRLYRLAKRFLPL